MTGKFKFVFTLAAAFLFAQFAIGQEAKHFTADKHVAKGLDCAACHGDGPKKPVHGAKCLECHTSFEEVAKKTTDIKPNPHANHIVESSDLECTECHQGHKADVVYCANCHSGLAFKRNSAPAADKT